MKNHFFKYLIIILIPISNSSILNAQENQKLLSEKLEDGIKSGKIAYNLTDADEIKAYFGNPATEKDTPDGGMIIKKLFYPNMEIYLGKFRNDKDAPFVLLRIQKDGINIDIGRARKLILRSNKDFNRINSFSGLCNVSLKNIDLHSELNFINKFSFDNLTEWPEKNKLPAGFEPDKLLENHKTPGLGIRELHNEGITGKGIGIAIIDQPLLLGHDEYSSSITRYDATGLLGFSPQMHGSPVVSIAIGKNLGVAPDAALTYFAVPMWENSNLHYIAAINRIFELNKTLPINEKIRIISISTGDFSGHSNYQELSDLFNRAEKEGIFIITCDQKRLSYGILSAVPGSNPDDINNYVAGKYIKENDPLRIPAGNRTIASHLGNNVYTFDREGGMSWAAPYIAGLAALAFQVKSDLKPDEIRNYLVETAIKTDAGPVVNPKAFIKKIQSLK